MSGKFEVIIQLYLSDSIQQLENQQIVADRASDINILRLTLKKFSDKNIHLKEFINQLQTTLARSTDHWGLGEVGVYTELNRFEQRYANQSGRPATEHIEILRELLRTITLETVGEKIEELTGYLQEAQQRLRQAEKLRTEEVAPIHGALWLSLFALWEYWAADNIIIYYPRIRQSMKLLIEAGLLTNTNGMRIGRDGIIILNNADHRAFMQTLQELPGIDRLRGLTGEFWAEFFLRWVTSHTELLDELVGAQNTTKPLDKWAEAQNTTNSRILEDKKLPALTETELQERIATIRREILIDEKVVRRIYYALLTGHVILTGPPGTGKTVLAQKLPEILWASSEEDEGEPTAYTTQLVTATDEWSVRTLIGGLAPGSNDNGHVSYHIQYGYLTETINRNWTPDAISEKTWNGRRASIYAPSYIDKGKIKEFRGQWLIIDEFNRAPIDLALGEAVTALSNGSGGKLRVPGNDGTVGVPLPEDFRIIGTLNSFDRNYLNQISEALKRRFSFIEILPPTRQQREAEQVIVLRQVMESLREIIGRPTGKMATIVRRVIDGNDTTAYELYMREKDQKIDRIIYFLSSEGPPDYTYIEWGDSAIGNILESVFDATWNIFEVIRVYRQLGTAQAIALFKQIFITGFLQEYEQEEQWIEAVDAALCDTLADQLQVLMADELGVLYDYTKAKSAERFVETYSTMLKTAMPRRRKVQLETLANVRGEDGQTILTDEELERLMEQTQSTIMPQTLVKIFHLDKSRIEVPQFARRLRVFKGERGL